MSITLEHISYIYAQGTPYEATAVEDVSLTITDGEFVGIMGKTGCGKSTLIQLIDALLEPAGGRILLDGEDIHARRYDRRLLRQKIGVVFQYPEHQLFETTVSKDVAFGLKDTKLTKTQVDERVKWALETVGFDYEEVWDLSPLEFSGGEKRRIAIAGVLAPQPKILILDEPIAGLDPLGRDAFLKLLKQLNRQGTTILMVSHNADVLAEYAGRILVLEQGRLIKDGPTAEVFSDKELIKRHEIGTGQVRRIAAMLQEKGYHLPDTVVRYEQLLPYLCRIGRGELP